MNILGIRFFGLDSNICHGLFVGWVEHPNIFCWVSFLNPTYVTAIFLLSAKPNKMAEDRTVPDFSFLPFTSASFSNESAERKFHLPFAFFASCGALLHDTEFFFKFLYDFVHCFQGTFRQRVRLMILDDVNSGLVSPFSHGCPIGIFHPVGARPTVK